MNGSDMAAVSTVAGALMAATTRLRDAGIPNPQREAVDVWSGLYHVAPGESWLRREESVPPRELAAFQTAVEARATGVPVQYVVGRAAFRHLTLAVDRRVLIPRPETEGLVDHVLLETAARPSAHVLEIGVGSGAVICSLAIEARFGRLVGTDVSVEALQVARANADAIAPDVRIEWRVGDCFAPVAGERFDVVVSNPPYVAPSEYEGLERSVRLYEPRIALESPDNGMAHIRRICEKAGKHLRSGGMLILEIDARRGELASRVARRSGLRDVRLARDLFGRDRYLLARGP